MTPPTKPYDARTLRYVARALRKEATALHKIWSKSGDIEIRARSKEIEDWAGRYLFESRQIEKAKARK